MKPIEFEKKYKPYDLVHLTFTGKEIKEDALSLLYNDDGGYAYFDESTGYVVREKGCSSFEKVSIISFIGKFIHGKYPLSDKTKYYLEFVGCHEDILIAKRSDLQ